MYIVIVGCGKVGYQLARAMLALGHEVLAVEKDVSRCEAVNEELGSVAFPGDGTRVQTLKEAGVARADVVIAVTSRDEDNLAACQMARHLYNAPRTVSLIQHTQNEALFRVLGVDSTINITHLVLASIEEVLSGHSLVHRMNLKTPDQQIVSVTIPQDAAVVGKPIGDIALPRKSFISLVVKQEGPLLPSNEIILEAEDDVVVVTSTDEEMLLFETLTGVV